MFENHTPTLNDNFSVDNGFSSNRFCSIFQFLNANKAFHILVNFAFF